jgi:hypothetical protein
MIFPMWNEGRTGILFSNGQGGLRYVDSGPEFEAHKDTAGDFVQIPDPQPDADKLAEAARIKRNGLLAASDWTQLADAPVDQAAWAEYRQALRDVPSQAGFPATIDWPVAPS